MYSILLAAALTSPVSSFCFQPTLDSTPTFAVKPLFASDLFITDRNLVKDSFGHGTENFFQFGNGDQFRAIFSFVVDAEKEMSKSGPPVLSAAYLENSSASSKVSLTAGFKTTRAEEGEGRKPLEQPVTVEAPSCSSLAHGATTRREHSEDGSRAPMQFLPSTSFASTL